ncbi:hypothetical protein NE237_005557 [Protea cynaroides]|uniref:Uncharacterized protein n=1 Tax=Protea cynaroides TaxID=273540 RepID=A0A9Q0GL03_9MAGN|nr:hypothetical protein NE237_005557 [Protea cynaroides]
MLCWCGAAGECGMAIVRRWVRACRADANEQGSSNEAEDGSSEISNRRESRSRSRSEIRAENKSKDTCPETQSCPYFLWDIALARLAPRRNCTTGDVISDASQHGLADPLPLGSGMEELVQHQPRDSFPDYKKGKPCLLRLWFGILRNNFPIGSIRFHPIPFILRLITRNRILSHWSHWWYFLLN